MIILMHKLIPHCVTRLRRNEVTHYTNFGCEVLSPVVMVNQLIGLCNSAVHIRSLHSENKGWSTVSHQVRLENTQKCPQHIVHMFYLLSLCFIKDDK